MQKPTNTKVDMKDHNVKQEGRDNCRVCVLFTIFLVFVFMFVMICIGVVYIHNLQTNLVNLEKRVRDLEKQSCKQTTFKREDNRAEKATLRVKRNTHDQDEGEDDHTRLEHHG
ncbi:hypothetical protein EB796_006495 [Bugula neritina]|uniref:Uncharacterized protein n=1 Tax=Bugula neritina TaxID=10212 RepID=A0A7J7KAF5_BUGNE|nr:hypothetical protein EB796_006495 [Bugula neritina]